MKVRLPHNGWKPRSYQLPLWRYLENGGKRAAAVWHRRAGKDELTLHFTATQVMQKPATYWHMLPQASQARKAIWEAINPHTGRRRIDEAFPLEIRATTREQEMMIKFVNGATWQVVGSDNFNSLVGSPPYGVVFSEWSLANPSAWAYLRPILAENGGWAFFIYTPRGKNHGHSIIKTAQASADWFGQILTADQTGVFTPETLVAERQELVDLYGEDMGDAMFQQEYYCSFDAAVIGAYYGAELTKLEQQGRIRESLFDPSLPVFTSFDLGWTDDTDIWFFQVQHGEVRFIDHYANHGKDVQHYCEALHGRKIVVDSRNEADGSIKRYHLGDPIEEHAHRQQYRYGMHWVPHDAAPKTLGNNGRSIIQQAFSMGIKMRLVPSLSLQDGIQSVRQMLPKVWFDKRCEDAIEALKQYRRKWEDDKKIFSDNPLHDWTSHTADSFRYASLVWKNPLPAEEEQQPRFLHDMTANDIFWPANDTPNGRSRI